MKAITGMAVAAVLLVAYVAAGVSVGADCKSFVAHHQTPGHDGGYDNVSLCPGWRTEVQIQIPPPDIQLVYHEEWDNSRCGELPISFSRRITSVESYTIGGSVSQTAEFEAAASTLVLEAAIAAQAEIRFNGQYTRTYEIEFAKIRFV